MEPDLPQLEPWHRLVEESLDALTREALGEFEPSDRTLEVVRALIDLSTWRVFKERGLSSDDATEIIAGLIEYSLR